MWAALLVALLAACGGGAHAQWLSRAGWQATASSVKGGDPPWHALDANQNTFWHSYYAVGGSGEGSPMPHNLNVNFNGQVNSVKGIVYRGRAGNEFQNGRVADYEVRAGEAPRRTLLGVASRALPRYSP